MHVLVVEMAGYEQPWFLVTSALELSAAQVVAIWAARFRQEDGFREHKQHLGMEECRAWTRPGRPGGGGANRHGIVGSAMPRSWIFADCSGGSAESFRRSSSPWRTSKKSRSPSPDARSYREGCLIGCLKSLPGVIPSASMEARLRILLPPLREVDCPGSRASEGSQTLSE